jgi:serine/threonine-protein kinase
VPSSLDAIVLKAMAKGPANRYQSAAEMRGDLVRVLSGQRPAAPMVMTDEDRTSIMGAGRATEVMGGGRHRPAAMVDDYDDYDDYDPDAQARRKRRKALIVAAWVIGAIGLIALVAWLLPKLFTPGETNSGRVEVPSVVGQSQAIATQTINSKGFLPRTVYIPCQTNSNGSAPCTADQIGKVLSTDPPSGTFLAAGGTVTLNVGGSPQPVTVPDLTGMTQQQAQATLQHAGLQMTASQTTTPTTDPTQLGKVASQVPNAQGQAQPGSTVTITLYGQPQPVPVPDVTKMPYAQAAQQLQGQGFKVKKQTKADSAPAETVIEENPAVGSQVAPNSTITLIVSDGSLTAITVPTLVGLTQAQAQQALQAQGWTGQFNITRIPPTDPSQDGLITDSNPEAGQQMAKNQTVNLTISQYGAPPTPTTSTTPPHG